MGFFTEPKQVHSLKSLIFSSFGELFGDIFGAFWLLFGGFWAPKRIHFEGPQKRALFRPIIEASGSILEVLEDILEVILAQF